MTSMSSVIFVIKPGPMGRAIMQRVPVSLLAVAIAGCSVTPADTSSTVGTSAIRDQGRVATPDQNAVLNGDSALIEIMRDADIPGLALARVEDGRVSQVMTLGRRDAMNARPDAPAVDQLTVCEGASLGKPLLALATLQLVEKGKLNLDTRAASIVPLEDSSDARKDLVTIRMLLSHTSGLAFNQPTFEAQPGERFSYSTFGYRYLQRVVESKLGKPFEAWVQDTLVAPLGLARTSFVYGEQFADNRATGRNWLMVQQQSMTTAAGAAAFDLITTPKDYATIWAHVLSGSVVSQPTLASMFTPQREIKGEMFDPAILKKSTVQLACGLGVLLERQGDRWIAFQWGDNGGSTGLLVIEPQENRAVVFMTNAQDGLHAGEAIAHAAGARISALPWLGYEQYTTATRTAWKRVTAACDRGADAGTAAFTKLLSEDEPSARAISRNLGYFNRFKGRVAESEPFFRVASTIEPAEIEVLGNWAEALVLVGRVEEAALAQQRAVAIDSSLASLATLQSWIDAAKSDLADAARDQKDLSESFAEHVGTYGEYSLELDGQNGPTLVTPRGRKALVLVHSGDAITKDMVYRIRFGGGELDVTVAGGATSKFSKIVSSGFSSGRVPG